MQRQSSPIDCHSVRTNRKDLMELVLYGSCWSQRGTIIQPPALQFVPVNSMSILCQSTKTIDAIKYECCQSVSNSRPISYHPANPWLINHPSWIHQSRTNLQFSDQSFSTDWQNHGRLSIGYLTHQTNLSATTLDRDRLAHVMLILRQWEDRHRQ